MAEYTPTTDQVRAIFAGNGDWRHTGEPFEREAEFDRWLAEHDREVRAPLQELIEEARETLTVSSVPLGMTEAQFYRNLVHLAWGILSRDVSDDAGDPR